jgi:hypothetical protein
MVSFPIALGDLTDIHWFDSQGRKLPYTVATKNGQSVYTISLIKPVMPGQPYAHKNESESLWLATRDGDVWTYQAGWSFGHRSNRYMETVTLPAGAEIISTDLEPAARCTIDGKVRLTFKGRRGLDEPFRYKIQYRLPD